MLKFSLTIILILLSSFVFAQHKEEEICYSNIPFLATEAQYNSVLNNNIQIIADSEFELLPNFINDQLYYLEIRSQAFSFIEYSKALAAMRTLINTVKEKYGRGRMIRQTIYQEHFEDKNISTAHTWQVKSKAIEVGLKLNAEGYVVAFCKISNPKITKPLVKWRAEENQKDIKESSRNF